MSPRDEPQSELLPGFSDYGVQANEVFRTCLDALSRPGRHYSLAPSLVPPEPLSPTAAAVLLTLADFETSCWLDPMLRGHDDVRAFISFHTGARITDVSGEADFAVIADVPAMPRLDTFKAGTPEYPDRSTTLIIQIDRLETTGLRFSGPGIDGEIRFSCDPMPDDLAGQLEENRMAFPCGVDLVFVTPTHIAALPRSVTHLGEKD